MTELVARLGALSNATHGFIYFAPEAAEEYAAVGLAGNQQYFASRAAAMGPVGPEIVVATFFNFCPDRVNAVVPACWEAAAPEQVQLARMRAAGRVLNDACPDVSAESVAEATELLQAMVDGVGDEGKPLAAANRGVALPDDPWIRFWQLMTVVREWRGDAHLAALTINAVNAVEALVLHAATEQVPKAALQMTRGWPEASWEAAVASLVGRGLLNADETFTDAGRSFRENIEAETNRGSQPLVDAIGDEATQRLYELVKPIRNGLIASGVFAKLPGT